MWPNKLERRCLEVTNVLHNDMEVARMKLYGLSKRFWGRSLKSPAIDVDEVRRYITMCLFRRAAQGDLAH